jgi:hypothetical protein
MQTTGITNRKTKKNNKPISGTTKHLVIPQHFPNTRIKNDYYYKNIDI